MSQTLADILEVVFTILGAGLVSVLAAWLTRKSQHESNRINEANGLIARYESLTQDIQDERDGHQKEGRFFRIQISLWRKYARKLRAQIHSLGAEPVDPDDDLEI